MNIIKKHVRANSIDAACAAADLGNFLNSQREVDEALASGQLYCVEVEIFRHSASTVKPSA